MKLKFGKDATNDAISRMVETCMPINKTSTFTREKTLKGVAEGDELQWYMPFLLWLSCVIFQVEKCERKKSGWSHKVPHGHRLLEASCNVGGSERHLGRLVVMLNPHLMGKQVTV